MLILSVYDKKSKKYDQVFSKSSEPEAIREFVLACRQPNLMYSQFPEDFELHRLGYISGGSADIQCRPDAITESDSDLITVVLKPKVLMTAENAIALTELSKKNESIGDKINQIDAFKDSAQ